MPQKLIQTQAQKLQQLQKLSQQQMMVVKMLEMPLAELEQNVEMELDDNPAMESASPDDAMNDNHADNEPSTTEEPDGEESFEDYSERENRKDGLDSVLDSIGKDDALPDYEHVTNSRQTADYEEQVYGDSTSFYDKLNEQVGELELTDKQRYILEYLIGSLDEDGLLRKPLDSIEDELAIYHNIDASKGEIKDMLDVLQDFDPAGIGARNLKECLLLQVERKKGNPVNMLLYHVIDECYDDFLKKRWDRIKQHLSLTDSQITALQSEILKLNPKPGASMGETMGRNMEQITPDFIVDTDADNHVSFTINKGRIPDLYVSPSFLDMLDTYKQNKRGMNRETKEALLYAKQKVDRAQSFIEAVKQRRHTLYVTMKAIVAWQHKFFIDGDEADLRPMTLKDIADKTGLDISTISRVSNVKYAQTRWGTFPLRYFFTESYTTEDGEELSTRKIKIALKEIVDGEDKHKPLSDDALRTELERKGFPIARRTIAKYREQLGIPVARLRKA